MDVDIPEAESPDLVSLFDLSPEGFPWRDSRPHDIEARRAQMSDLLIFDILLSSGGLRQPDALYPPADAPALHRLLDAILHESTYDALKKDCLVYFLLKWHQDGREERFKDDRCIPPQFAMLSDAYWHLDSGIHVARAVSLLADVRLNRDFTSKIIQAISLSPNPSPLILQYLRTTKPLLTEPDDIDTYILALAESSLVEAWSYQRSFPEASATRKRLIHKVLEFCLAPSVRPRHVTELLGLPLSSYEQSLLHEYALTPPSGLPRASYPPLHDLVCVRLINAGKYADAIKLDRQLAGSGEAADRRRKLVDSFLAIMPAIERLAVEEQLGTLHRAKPVPAKPALPPPKYADLSMSWEEVEPVNRALAAPASKPFVLGRPATRGPRFSGTTALPAFTNADDSFTVAGRGLFTSAAIPTATAAKGPRASLQMPLIDSAALNRKATAAPSAGPQLSNGLSSSVNGNGGLFAAQSGGSRNNLFGSTSTLTTTHVKPAHSLFLQASPNGSAVLPPPTNDGPRASASPPMDGFVEDEDEFGLADGGDEEDDEQPLPKRAPSSSPVEFSHSVFMNNGHAAVVKAAPQTLPGAFHADDDDLDLEAAAHTPPSPSTFPPPAKSRRTHGTSARRLPSPSPPPPPASRAKTRTRAQTKPVRVPGGFFDGEPEQEDEVPPLPDVSPVKRMVRKNRATASSRASSAEVEDRDDGVRVRRSARLSVASSSPEPVSVSPPKKPARKTRASTGAGKAVARRKR